MKFNGIAKILIVTWTGPPTGLGLVGAGDCASLIFAKGYYARRNGNDCLAKIDGNCMTYRAGRRLRADAINVTRQFRERPG
jgi:hypothetical protein